MGLEILKGGLQTTVQDEGRTGVYAAGLPPSGAMDKHATGSATSSSATPRARPAWR